MKSINFKKSEVNWKPLSDSFLSSGDFITIMYPDGTKKTGEYISGMENNKIHYIQFDEIERVAGTVLFTKVSLIEYKDEVSISIAGENKNE